MKQISKSHYKIDKVFLGSLLAVVILGLAILGTASVVRSIQLHGEPYYFLLRQAGLGVGVGLVWFLVTQQINFKVWKKISLGLFIISVALNAMVVVPGIGITKMGASRWLDFGIVEFQPSDVLKLTLVLYLSMVIVKDRSRLKQGSFFVVYFSVMALSSGIVYFLQSNLSTAILIYCIGLAILFLGNVPLKWMVVSVLIPILIGMGGLSTILLSDAGCVQELLGRGNQSGSLVSSDSGCMQNYRIRRIATFLGSEQSSEDDNYHSEQNLIAVGSGGWIGVGWGQSRQKFNYVPEAYGDSIFSIYAEETGFVGVVVLMLLYLNLVRQSLLIAFRSKDDYARLVIGGILTWFVLQAGVNIGANIALIPLTGVPLPFVSYGVTSIWVFFVAFGIIGNISKFQHKN